jgi:farnesyl diphosphate synthase
MASIREHVEVTYQTIAETLHLWRGDRTSELSELLEAALEERRPAGDRPPWLALPIFVCEALAADLGPAYYVAAGLELGRVAAGCLDEWQDQDTDGALWQTMGPAQMINLATAMIALSHLSVTRLADLDLDPALILSLQDEFSLTLLRMSQGQHADLSGSVDLDSYAEVAAAKSGSLLRLGCRAGAMVAGAAAEDVTRFGDFGQALGILAQAWNDLYGITGAGGKRDVEQSRSLPILATSALDPAQYEPGSASGQVGQLYALTQIQLLHRRAAEALSRCPAPGRLGLFLDAYSFDRLSRIEPRHDRTSGGGSDAP